MVDPTEGQRAVARMFLGHPDQVTQYRIDRLSELFRDEREAGRREGLEEAVRTSDAFATTITADAEGVWTMSASAVRELAGKIRALSTQPVIPDMSVPTLSDVPPLTADYISVDDVKRAIEEIRNNPNSERYASFKARGEVLDRILSILGLCR